MRSIRSVDGRVGKDEVPGFARGPENSAARAGDDHDAVLTVGADVVERVGQLAVR
jgi:hypothetical protein